MAKIILLRDCQSNPRSDFFLHISGSRFFAEKTVTSLWNQILIQFSLFRSKKIAKIGRKLLLRLINSLVPVVNGWSNLSLYLAGRAFLDNFLNDFRIRKVIWAARTKTPYGYHGSIERAGKPYTVCKAWLEATYYNVNCPLIKSDQILSIYID